MSLVKIWEEVFRKPKYVVIFLITMVLFYSLSVMFANFKIIINQNIFITIKYIPTFLINYHKFVAQKIFIGLLITVFLAGILFSFIFYRVNMINSISGKSGIFASLGLFFGVVAQSCLSCTIGFLSFLGISSVILASFPFKGFEFIMLSILLLSFSIYKASIAIDRGTVCEIKTDRKKLKGGEKNE